MLIFYWNVQFGQGITHSLQRLLNHRPSLGLTLYAHDTVVIMVAQQFQTLSDIVGIDATTSPVIVAAGADTLVAGNAVFGQETPAEAVKTIYESATANT